MGNVGLRKGIREGVTKLIREKVGVSSLVAFGVTIGVSVIMARGVLQMVMVYLLHASTFSKVFSSVVIVVLTCFMAVAVWFFHDMATNSVRQREEHQISG